MNEGTDAPRTFASALHALSDDCGDLRVKLRSARTGLMGAEPPEQPDQKEPADTLYRRVGDCSEALAECLRLAEELRTELCGDVGAPRTPNGA